MFMSNVYFYILQVLSKVRLKLTFSLLLQQIGTRISRKRGCPATITVRRIVRFPDHALYPEDMAKGKSDWAIREKKADILFRLKTRLRNGQVGLVVFSIGSFTI